MRTTLLVAGALAGIVLFNMARTGELPRIANELIITTAEAGKGEGKGGGGGNHHWNGGDKQEDDGWGGGCNYCYDPPKPPPCHNPCGHEKLERPKPREVVTGGGGDPGGTGPHDCTNMAHWFLNVMEYRDGVGKYAYTFMKNPYGLGGPGTCKKACGYLQEFQQFSGMSCEAIWTVIDP